MRIFFCLSPSTYPPTVSIQNADPPPLLIRRVWTYDRNDDAAAADADDDDDDDDDDNDFFKINKKEQPAHGGTGTSRGGPKLRGSTSLLQGWIYGCKGSPKNKNIT